jgi:hypothetical protein
MSEMFITTGDLPTHLIDDYDFLFENGYLLPVSIP